MTLAHEPPAPGARVEAGVAWLGHGECARAEVELAAALAQDPGCPGARVGLARVCVRSGRPIEALDLLVNALEWDPTDLDAHLLLAVCRAQIGQVSGVRPALSGALELVLTLPPSIRVPWDPARRAAAASSRLESLRAAVAERPGYADRRVALALRLLVEGLAREATTHLEAALGRNPEYLEARLLAARSCLERGLPEAALLHLERALAAHPDYPDLRFWSGLAHARARRFPEAAAALERALRSNRHFARAHRLLAPVYHALGRTRDALRAARCGLAREGDAAYRARSRRGWEAWRLPEFSPFEDSTLAEASLVAAIGRQPGYPDLHLALARLRRARGHLVRARETCRRALALQPDYPAALLEMACLELDLGGARRAVPLLRQVLVERPRWADARALLARACRALPPVRNRSEARGRPAPDALQETCEKVEG